MFIIIIKEKMQGISKKKHFQIHGFSQIKSLKMMMKD